VADAARRLKDLWRKADRVVGFEAAAGEAEVRGLLAPGGGRGRPSLTLLVNGRAVRDRLIVGAVMRVLRSAGSGFGGARVVVDLRLPPEDVDVNVHPAKTEVRFTRSGSVFALIERAVRAGVASSHGQVEVRSLEDDPQEASAEQRRTSGYGGLLRDRQAVARPEGLFPHPAYEPSRSGGSAGVAEGEGGWPPQAGAGKERSGARAGDPDTPFGRLIGQYRDSFLLLEDELGLAIVDQHVAHERVLFDQIKRRLKGAAAPSQRLLNPRLLEVDEARAAALPRIAPLLARVGIEADLFGPDTVRVSAVPAELEAEAVDAVVEELLDRATALDGAPENAPQEIEEELASSLSCRGAIKINHRLTVDEQRALLVDLVNTDNPYRCPHGRPIILRLSQEEMERRLGRR
jgi:DNA mismatch repair protein MutL